MEAQSPMVESRSLPPERVAAFLEYACPDARVIGPGARRSAQNAAMRILTRHPDIARDSLYTAVVCGDLEEVQRILSVRPDAASENGGPKGWPPLLYLCNARLPLATARDNPSTLREPQGRPEQGRRTTSSRGPVAIARAVVDARHGRRQAGRSLSARSGRGGEPSRAGPVVSDARREPQRAVVAGLTPDAHAP